MNGVWRDSSDSDSESPNTNASTEAYVVGREAFPVSWLGVGRRVQTSDDPSHEDGNWCSPEDEYSSCRKGVTLWREQCYFVRVTQEKNEEDAKPNLCTPVDGLVRRGLGVLLEITFESVDLPQDEDEQQDRSDSYVE